METSGLSTDRSPKVRRETKSRTLEREALMLITECAEKVTGANEMRQGFAETGNVGDFVFAPGKLLKRCELQARNRKTIRVVSWIVFVFQQAARSLVFGLGLDFYMLALHKRTISVYIEAKTKGLRPKAKDQKSNHLFVEFFVELLRRARIELLQDSILLHCRVLVIRQ